MERTCLAVVLASAFLLLPQAQAQAQTRIAVLSSSEPSNERFDGIVRRCAAIALGRAGLVALPAEEASDEDTRLECFTRLDGTEFELGMVLRSRGRGQTLAVSRLSGSIDLGFDLRLIESFSALLAGLSLKPETELAEAKRLPALAPSAPAGSIQPLPDPPDRPIDRVPAEAPLFTGAEPGVAAGSAPLPAPPAGRFSLLLASAPVFVLGEAAEFFRYGFDASGFLGLAARAGVFGFEGGLRVGYVGVIPEGRVQGRVHAATLSLELRLRLPVEGTIALTARAGGGPVYLVAIPDSGEVFGKLVAGATAGLGLSLRLGPAFTVGIECGAFFAFERSAPLSCLVPGAFVAWRP